MSHPSINAERLLAHIRALGAIGRDDRGQLTRLAASDTEKLGRDRLVGWIEAAGLDVAVDRIGNIFGIWSNQDNVEQLPLM
ncbi:MAG: Zn-dependent hydrolase, partial [Ensifer adhaerens]